MKGHALELKEALDAKTASDNKRAGMIKSLESQLEKLADDVCFLPLQPSTSNPQP